MKLLDLIFDIFAGFLTGQRLQEAGASPAEAAAALTLTTDLPTFAEPEGAPPALDESRDLEDCHPELHKRFLALAADFEREHARQLIPTCTYRSKQRQHELYQIGRRGVPGEKVVTMLDGITKHSRHNVYPAEAIDVAVDTDPGPGKHIVWDHDAYLPLAELAARHGLIWGGGWASIHDDPHLELPPEAA